MRSATDDSSRRHRESSRCRLRGCALLSSNDGLIRALFFFPCARPWFSGREVAIGGLPRSPAAARSNAACLQPEHWRRRRDQPPRRQSHLRYVPASAPRQYRSSARPPPMPRCRPHDAQCRHQTLLICSPHRSAEPSLVALELPAETWQKNSIATLRIRLASTLVLVLPRCPCCGTIRQTRSRAERVTQ